MKLETLAQEWYKIILKIMDGLRRLWWANSSIFVENSHWTPYPPKIEPIFPSLCYFQIFILYHSILLVSKLFERKHGKDWPPIFGDIFWSLDLKFGWIQIPPAAKMVEVRKINSQLQFLQWNSQQTPNFSSAKPSQWQIKQISDYFGLVW